jgi:hypothetical protein
LIRDNNEISGAVLAVLRKIHPPKSRFMITPSHHSNLQSRANELGISKDIISCALNILGQNRNLVNAIDNGAEMDEYIYRAVLKQAFDNRKQKAKDGLFSEDEQLQLEAKKDLSVLSREELVSDPFYRAVLPLMVKVLANEPIQRLHAEEASTIVMQLADMKRRFRSTSVTEVIVKKCSMEMAQFAVA